MTDKLETLLDDLGLLLAEGATGINLFSLGLQTGEAPELWNIDHPDRIASLHQSFVNAGSDIISSNGFGGTHYPLALHKAGHRVAELNTADGPVFRTRQSSLTAPAHQHLRVRETIHP